MLYQRLQGEKFGARRGIIPLFLAKKLSEIEGTAVIYIGEKELEITSENLNHVNDFPENYALYLETETVEKEKYLKEIEAIFACNEENFDGQSRFIQIVGSMQKWYRSLPQYTMITLNLPDKQCTAIKKLRNLLRRAEINPRELLFEKILTHRKYIRSPDSIVPSFRRYFIRAKIALGTLFFLRLFLAEKHKKMSPIS